MERLTRRDITEINGGNIVMCNYEKNDCNDSCMYGKCKWNCKALEKLKYYEDLEEQGLILKLPCKVGDEVAIVLMIPSTGKKYIEQAEVKEINIGKFHTREDIQLKVEPVAKRGTTYKYYVSEWGKNVFPTLAEAEKALTEAGCE